MGEVIRVISHEEHDVYGMRVMWRRRERKKGSTHRTMDGDDGSIDNHRVEQEFKLEVW